MNNVECLSLETMLHLEIQKEKEAMKTSNFQKNIVGTTVCMKRLCIPTKGCGQLTSNDTYFDDIWFSYLKTAEEVMSTGVDYCRPARTSHKGFCLATLEKLIKNCPVGSYLVTKSTPRFTGEIPLPVIG